MKMQGRKGGRCGLLILLFLSALLLTGCGSNMGKKTIATLDEEKITFSEALFYTRMNQLQWEREYVTELGSDFWSEPIGEGEQTYGEELKTQVMDTICQIHLMNAHAEEYQVALTEEDEAGIEERVQNYLDTYGENVQKEAGADKKLVQRLLTEKLLSDKVAEAMVADYTPEINEEETALSKMTYCLFSTLGTYDLEGGSHEVTEEEAEEIWQEAWDFAGRAKELGDLKAAAKEVNHTCVDVYFNEYTDGGAHEKVAERARLLEPGRIDGPIETEEGYYVIQYVTFLDEEATEQNREMLRQQGKEEKCREIYEGWKNQAEFVIDQELWDQIQVDEVLFEKSEAEFGESSEKEETESGESSEKEEAEQ